MKRLIPSTNETMLFRLSRDAEFYNGSEGRYEVIYSKCSRRVFYSLLEAFLFYFTVEEEAQLWDRTGKEFLIEEKVKLHLN